MSMIVGVAQGLGNTLRLTFHAFKPDLSNMSHKLSKCTTGVVRSCLSCPLNNSAKEDPSQPSNTLVCIMEQAILLGLVQ